MQHLFIGWNCTFFEMTLALIKAYHPLKNRRDTQLDVTADATYDIQMY